MNLIVINLFWKILSRCFLAVVFVLPVSSWALSTDRQKDIEIEADSALIDDAKQQTIYTGDVVIIQGSLRITGAKVTIHYDDNSDFIKLESVGKPARFRQLPDGKKDIDSNYQVAHADRMEYFKKKDLIILLGNAVYGQGGSKVAADRIEYNSRTSQMTARSVKAKTKTKSTAENKKKKSRVRIVIPAKKKVPN